MREASRIGRGRRPMRAAATAAPEELALKVATVYQDPLTRHWANELWDRVGELMGSGCTHRESWSIQELRDAVTFTSAAEAAAAADVVVISVRGGGDLPLVLRGWIDAWVPRRTGRTGALVALIGLPGQPDLQAHHTLQFFEAVAREAGLDFLPHEKRLPETPFATNLTEPWAGRESRERRCGVALGSD